jgi:hypothetical protein
MALVKLPGAGPESVRDVVPGAQVREARWEVQDPDGVLEARQGGLRGQRIAVDRVATPVLLVETGDDGAVEQLGNSTHCVVVASAIGEESPV